MLSCKTTIALSIFIISFFLNAQEEKIDISKTEKSEQKEEENKPISRDYIFVPLPFYGTTTGYGISLKFLASKLKYDFYFDSVSVATTENQYAIFNSIGQKKFFFFPKVFWEHQLGGTHLTINYYGKGNQNDIDNHATYHHRSYILTTKVGYTFLPELKTYLIHSHKVKRLSNFENESGKLFYAWESLPYKNIKETRIGYGIQFTNVDSTVRPSRGVSINYEYLIASPFIFKNTYSFREAQAGAAFYLPITKNISHGTNLFYLKVSHSAPFYEDPTIRVRGIEKRRHKDKLSIAIQNEEQISITDEWIIVPFWDIGRVYNEYATKKLFSDLHLGYGLGVRYIIKNELAVRFDVATSKGGEIDFVFNYGHTF